MGLPIARANDDYLIDAMGASNPVTELHPDGSFNGMASALGKSAIGGIADVSSMVGGLAQAGGDKYTGPLPAEPLGGAKTPDEFKPDFEETLKGVQEWSQMDPATTGKWAQVGGATLKGLEIAGAGSLIAGPVGAGALLGSTTAHTDYQENIKAGMDPTTAAEKAGLTGSLAAASAFLPMKFGSTGAVGLAKSMAGGALINTGTGIAQRALTSELLNHAGYTEMAKQYQPMDAQAMIADGILGLAFGGFAHLTHGEAPPTKDLIDTALNARRDEMLSRAGPGIPTDPLHANLDSRLQDEALGNMMRGQPSDVSTTDAQNIVEHSLLDPERLEYTGAYEKAMVDVHGAVADMTQPERLPYEAVAKATADLETQVKGEAVPEPKAPGETAAPKLSDTAASSLKQLAAAHPDMEVQLPDGRTVKASDMETQLQASMDKANKDSLLHDVAVACFMRTI